MNVWHPAREGRDHINVYSKSSLPLGRALSNFFRSQFVFPGYGKFESVEGFYYWLLTGKKHDKLKKLHGFQAKQYGESKEVTRRVDKKFKEEIQMAICYKIMHNDYIQRLLIDSNLPLAHYYYYGDIDENPKVIDQFKKHQYMIEAIEEIRIRLQREGRIHMNYGSTKPSKIKKKKDNFNDLI